MGAVACSGGENTAGENTAGENTAGENTAGKDSANGDESAGAPCSVIGGLGSDVDRVPTVRTAGPAANVDDGVPRVLLFTRTEGFRHGSIDDALAYFSTLHASGVLDVSATEETDPFTAEGLAEFDVVAFVNTTGDVLDNQHQDALVSWLEAGGAFVGVHSATDTEHGWPWFAEMIGARFVSHPPWLQNVTITVEDRNHPATEHLEATFDFLDEHYNYDRSPRDGAEVLLTLDEATAVSLEGEPVTEFSHHGDHPVSWTRQQGSGRVFYTNLGHDPRTWEDPRFQGHLLGGLRWALESERWRREVITEDVEGAVALRVAPSGHVMWIERPGDVHLWDPTTGLIHDVASLDAKVQGEGGLIGIELAPDVATTGDVYLYWTRERPDGDLENVVARYHLDDRCRLDTNEGTDLLTVPNDGPGHQGGDLLFHPDGSLLVATGDNTVATDYAAIDDGRPLGQQGSPLRTSGETADARRTAGDPTDLRGAILRIEVDGTAAAGNLADTGVEAAPEVFVTGVRNPFRLAVEPGSGALWWGDVGPDAIFDGDPGPRGFDELNRVNEPGDAGWPTCIADLAYNRFDPTTGEFGPPYDCGDRVVPVLSYDYTTLGDPALGLGVRATPEGVQELGRSVMAGPFITGDDGPAGAGRTGLVIHDFSRSLILVVSLTDAGEVLDLDRLVPWVGITSPVDVELAPDGALYVLEYGDYARTQGVPALTRIERSADGTFPDFPAARRATTAPDQAMGADGLFQLHCAVCHGGDGSGGVGPSLVGVDERLTVEEMRAVVTDGRGGMPAFRYTLDEDEFAEILDHVRGGLAGG